MQPDADKEMRWVDAWNDLYDIVGDRADFPCVLPDWREVNVEECKGWLQDRAYEGLVPRVERGWLRSRPAVIARCGP